MYAYSAYGLAIHSEIRLPELGSPSCTQPDVTVRFGRIARRRPPAHLERDFQVTDRETYAFWRGTGAFSVRDGREIVIEPDPPVDEEILRLPLLGPVLAMLLDQRGHLLLHASAVAIHGAVAAFVANADQGKSTLAAALCRRGHGLMSDDVLAVRFDQNGNPVVHPAFPLLKLWPDAVTEILREEPGQRPQLHASVEKRRCDMTDAFLDRPARLHQLYFLQKGSEVDIAPLGPQQALMRVIRHSYLARLSEQFVRRKQAHHLGQCGQLVQGTQSFSLSHPRSLPALAATVEMIEQNSAVPVGAT